MESLSQVDVADFEAVLTPARLRALRLLHVGFAMAMVSMAIVAAVLAAASPGHTAPRAVLLVKALSVANLVFFFACGMVGTRLFDRQFTPERLADALHTPMHDHVRRPVSDPAQKCLAIVRRAVFLRLVCLDVSAGFAFAVCVTGILTGVLAAHPVYWLNAAPAVLLAGYALITFPSADRLRTLFLIKIASARRPG